MSFPRSNGVKANMKYSLGYLGAALLASSLVVACPSNSSAGWGHLRGGGSSGGSSGVYAAGFGSSGAVAAPASGGSSGYAAYSSVGAASVGGASSGGPGVLQRVAGRIQDHLAAKRARHIARRASYGSSGAYASSGGGSSGGYAASYASTGSGSSGGSRGSYSVSRVYSGGSSGSNYSSGVSYGSVGGSSYGSVGSSSSYGSAGGVYYGASTDSSLDVSSLVSTVDGDAVHLTVSVPSSAKIFVNGNPTTSTGAVREFVSRGLEPGKSYKFDVRAELEGVNGQQMVEDKTLVVTAGERENLQFAFAERATEIETAVTLNVPEGAKVLLSGRETAATGETRTFRTSQLMPGEVWDDYEVEVQLGDQSKKRTVRLLAGDQLQLTFAFDDEAAGKLASR